MGSFNIRHSELPSAKEHSLFGGQVIRDLPRDADPDKSVQHENVCNLIIYEKSMDSPNKRKDKRECSSIFMQFGIAEKHTVS